MRKILAVLAIVLVLGCAVARDTEKLELAGARALDRAGVAELELGHAGSAAFGSVAALSSQLAVSGERVSISAAIALDTVAGVASETRGVVEDFRTSEKSGLLGKLLVLGFVVVLVHAAASAWRTRSLVRALHDDVRELKTFPQDAPGSIEGPRSSRA